METTLIMPNDQKPISIDPGVFTTDFPEKHFQFNHDLAHHPLFKIERLLTLAGKLHPSCVEYNSGGADISQDPMTTPYTDLSPEETIKNIETCESWLVLKYVELDPDYRELLFNTIHQIVPMEQLKKFGAHQLEAYIFISSPCAVTPFHFDDEHNFLLQIRGSKQFHSWTKTGGGKATPEDLERYYLGGHRNLPIREHAEIADEIYQLQPGDGLHVPVHSPHWVLNGDQVSISFSVTFRSIDLSREALVHQLNGKLRSFGMNPKPYGENKVIDNTKYRFTHLIKKISKE